jgi:hypothetical protein
MTRWARNGLVPNRAPLRDSGKRCGRGKPRSWLAAKISGAFSFARRRCLVATGGRTGDAGIPVNGAAIFLKSGAAKFPSLAGLGDQPLA